MLMAAHAPQHQSREHQQILTGHTLCWTLAAGEAEKNPDFVLLEKKIKQVFAITLDECYNKVSKATLESKL